MKITTPAKVGAAPGANTDITSLGAIARLSPASDSTTAIRVTKADGTTTIETVDTTNGYRGINTTPLSRFHIKGNAQTSAYQTAIFLEDAAAVANSRSWSIGNGSYDYGDLDFAVGSFTGQDPLQDLATISIKARLGRDGSFVVGAPTVALPGAGIIAASGIKLSGGTAVTKILSATATLDFGSTVAGASTDLTITVTGAAVGDSVAIGAPNASVPAGGVFFGWVSATNTVTVRYANNSLLTTYDPASGTFRATVTQF